MEYVYEFTNKRKLTKTEFLKWFQKKAIYIIRKFRIISDGDVIVYENKRDFRGVVLEDILKMFSEKANVGIVKNKYNKKTTKTAISSTIDTEADKFIHKLIKGNAENLKNLAPVHKKIIKPLYLFLDKEVLLYAKLKNLKFKKTEEKKDKLSRFIDELEKNHPEIKRAIVNSYLELFF